MGAELGGVTGTDWTMVVVIMDTVGEVLTVVRVRVWVRVIGMVDWLEADVMVV